MTELILAMVAAVMLITLLFCKSDDEERLSKMVSAAAEAITICSYETTETLLLLCPQIAQASGEKDEDKVMDALMQTAIYISQNRVAGGDMEKLKIYRNNLRRK